jgi:hypothetical protein
MLGGLMEWIRTLHRIKRFLHCWLSQIDPLDVRPWRHRFVDWTPWPQSTLLSVTFYPVLSDDGSDE